MRDGCDLDHDAGQALAEEICGLRRGLICTIALLVNLLEERGALDEGLYRRCLGEALRIIEAEQSSTPETRVLREFARTLQDHPTGLTSGSH